MTHVTPNGRGLGWRPQLPDHRDHIYGAPPEIMAALPKAVDLRQSGHFLPPFDQDRLGSCTGNAIAGALQFERSRQGAPGAGRVPSRLFIYFNERAMEGTINSDAGAAIRDGIKSVSQLGACFEDGLDGWPYIVRNFAVKPGPRCYGAALKDRAVQYKAVPQVAQQLRGCLAEGFPFVFGFTCYPGLDDAEVAKTGLLPMPSPGEAPIGGHAVLAVGYDDATRRFIVRNSWGTAWAQGGYYTMAYEYLLRGDLASDFWTIRLVSG